MPPRRLLIAAVLWWAIALAGVAATSRADSIAPPFSYTKLSPDGRFLFVMIAPFTAEDDASYWNEQVAAEILAIRTTYEKSGPGSIDTASQWSHPIRL